MPTEIQEIADRLAGELNRSVFVEDARFRPLAMSAQLGAIDEPRVQAVLRREPAEEHVRYFRRCGVTTARAPLRVPGNAGLDLLPRVVVPVLAGDRTLARLWLIDADPPIGGPDLAGAREAAEEMRAVLLRHEESVRRRVAMAGRWFEEIERSGATERQVLFRRIQDSFGTADPDRLRACVVRLATPADTDEPPIGYLDGLLEHPDMRRCVGVVHGADVRVLVSDDGPDVAGRLAAAAHQTAAHHGVTVHAIGLGGVLGDADGLAASTRQAEFAARVAAATDPEAPACWDTLGEYRLFAAYEWGPAGVAAIDPAVAALVAEGPTPFAQTVLAYLDRQGDVSATADALSIHRTTLYYRLRQAQGILGEDLTGPARFRIHAALRFARLTCL